MNRNRNRKPNSRQRRVLHQIESSPYARLAIISQIAPVQTKVIK